MANAKVQSTKKDMAIHNRLQGKSSQAQSTTGQSSAAGSGGLDIHPMMLSRWRKEYREGKLQGDGQRRVGSRFSRAPMLVNGLTLSAPMFHRATLLKTCWRRYGSHYIALGKQPK